MDRWPCLKTAGQMISRDHRFAEAVAISSVSMLATSWGERNMPHVKVGNERTWHIRPHHQLGRYLI